MPVENGQRKTLTKVEKMKLTDGSLAAGSTVHGGHLEQTVGVDLEGGDELGLATGHGWDTVELELSEKSVVAALGSLSLVAIEKLMSVSRSSSP